METWGERAHGASRRGRAGCGWSRSATAVFARSRGCNVGSCHEDGEPASNDSFPTPVRRRWPRVFRAWPRASLAADGAFVFEHEVAVEHRIRGRLARAIHHSGRVFVRLVAVAVSVVHRIARAADG